MKKTKWEIVQEAMERAGGFTSSPVRPINRLYGTSTIVANSIDFDQGKDGVWSLPTDVSNGER